MFENKRGQEGVTLTTLLLIVLGVVVVVVIILFFTGVFDRLGGASDQLPGNLAAAAQACIISAKANSVTDFCYNFRELSDTQYSNCRDPRIIEELVLNTVDSLTCSNDEAIEAEVAKICQEDSEIIINNGELECPASNEESETQSESP